jgi:uncharacterized protein (TIGR00251 family)
MAPFRSESGAIVLMVRLTPRASRDGVDGIGSLSDGRDVVLARVRAIPEKGGANDALIKVIAEAFGVAKSTVEIAGGAAARLKQVRISGDPAALAAKVAALPRA